MIKQTDHYQNEFSAAWPGLPGYKISWLDHLRLRAINGFVQKGFPLPRAEDWKYTDLSKLLEQSYHLVWKPAATDTWERIKPLVDDIDAAITLVFVNGQWVRTVGNATDFPGLLLTNLKTAITERSVVLKDYLVDYPDTMTAFETLNTAFMNDGICLIVEPGTVVDKPVVILNVTSDKAELGTVYTRNLLVFGEKSKTRVIEKHLHVDGAANYLTNAVTQTVVLPGAEVEYCKIQEESGQAFHFAVNRIALQENSKFVYHDYSFGGRLSRSNLKVDFKGENATCSLNGLFMVDGDRQVDIYTDLEHAVPNCKSEETFRGVLDQNAKAVFRGKIKVYEDAQKTDARLSNTNLLLSENAEVNTMPQLEIYADDVKCSHGSSSGQLDEEQLFYLVSRGIDEMAAHDLLVFAFANTAIDKIESQEIRSHIRARMLSKLPDSSVIKELD